MRVKGLCADEGFELTNLSRESTGLHHRIFLRVNLRNLKHAHCKLEVGGAFYPISVEEPVRWLAVRPRRVSAREFERVKAFVRQNRKALLDHWNLRIDSADLIRRVRKIRNQRHW